MWLYWYSIIIFDKKANVVECSGFSLSIIISSIEVLFIKNNILKDDNFVCLEIVASKYL
uniref:Uncharacterized protein n=1 Tax=Physcomitrium patens TaxID=3218 RepID=A0A2K1L3Z7_PHYPA|nr:hypothetical protein PHYPA_003540 [Physcomitrium patens]